MRNNQLREPFRTLLNTFSEGVPEEPPKATWTICDNCGGEAGTDHETGLDICDECGVVESHTHEEEAE